MIDTVNKIFIKNKWVGWVYSGPSANPNGKRQAGEGRNARFTFFYEKGDTHGKRGPLHIFEVEAYKNGAQNPELVKKILETKENWKP